MRSGVCFITCMLISLSVSAFGYDWSTNPGDGSEGTPYQISTPEQLMSIGSNADLLDKHFILTHDIVFDPNNNPAHVFSHALIAPDTDDANGFQGTPFTGKLDGDGYSIVNLNIQNSQRYGHNLGLFGLIQGTPDSASVCNVSFTNPVINTAEDPYYVGIVCGRLIDGSVTNCHIESFHIYSDESDSSGNWMGGVAGLNEGGTIDACSASGLIVNGHENLGGLTGKNSGILQNSTADCDIIPGDSDLRDSSIIGGLTGENRGTISGCHAEGLIEGDRSFGGAVGLNYGTCLQSFFCGSIVCGESYQVSSGGFVCNNAGGTITECYAISHLYFPEEKTGGFVGRNTGTIRRCGSWSDIQCTSTCQPFAIGGFAGFHYDGTISDCYSQGMIHTYNEFMSNIGGFVGYGDVSISNCYTSFRQLHDQTEYTDVGEIGAFSGIISEDFLNNFFNIQRTQVTLDSAGAVPLNDDQMKTNEPFIEAGWDFVGEIENGSEDIWKIDENDYPRLRWLPERIVPGIENMLLADAQNAIESAGLTVGLVRYHYSDTVPAETVTIQSLSPQDTVIFGREVDLWVSNGQPCPYSGGGEGNPKAPCRLSTYDDLVLMGQTRSDYDKHFILTEDIDMDPDIPGQSVFSESVIGQPSIDSYLYVGDSFRGSFDGNHHSLSNLSIVTSERSSYIGLFGSTCGADISNLTLSNISYTSSTDQNYFSFSGGLIGRSVTGRVTNCSVTGEISTYYKGSYIGGLIGRSLYTPLKRCNANVNIDGKETLGGLVGYNTGTIQECSAAGQTVGNISSSYNCGGLVGDNYGDILRSYSTGLVSGKGAIGGLIGQNSKGAVCCCYSLSPTSGSSVLIGCLIGFQGSYTPSWGPNLDPITHCYAAGATTSSNIRGIIGHTFYSQPANITDCFWDIDAVGMDSEEYGTGLNSEQMQTQASFVGWDFMGEDVNGQNNIWRMCGDGVDYPRLSWEFAQNGDFACGDGVDLDDLAALAMEWLSDAGVSPETFNRACDANGDEVINLEDFGVLSENW